MALHEEAGPPVTRRRALGLVVAALGVAVVEACAPKAGEETVPRGKGEPGRLYARPTRRSGAATAGMTPAEAMPLGLGGARDALLRLPAHYRPDEARPLVVALHGAGGSARGGLSPFLPVADEAGLILLAPASRDSTWDFIRGPYGPDVAMIDRALGEVFGRCAVDPAHVVIGGFSDGASYALSLGLTNGDLFTHVVAFSPCVAAPAAQRGRPRVFVSHGSSDRVLPVDQCSRRIVPALRAEGYEVDYREFDGPHTVPPETARAAAQWLTAR